MPSAARTERKKRKFGERRSGLRGDDNAMRNAHYRVARLYGTSFDADLLEDDELEEIVELLGRVIETVVVGARPHIEVAHERRQAASKIAGLERLMERESDLLASMPHLREETERDIVALKQAGSSGGQLVEQINVNAITEEETLMLETLAAKAAGLRPDHFAWGRARQRIADVSAKLNLPEAPRRPRWEEPGSVTLPAAVFADLAGNRIDQGDWLLTGTAAGVAVLALLLHLFADPSSPLLFGDVARFDESGETLYIANGQVPFRINIDPDGQLYPHFRSTLQDLGHLGWFDVRNGGTEVRLGWRALPLFGREPAGTSTAARQ